MKHNQRLNEFEDITNHAVSREPTDLIPDGNTDNEGAMVKADLFKLANYSYKLFKKLEDDTQLESWVQAKVTKAADYIASVYHYLEYEMKFSEYGHQLDNSDVLSENQKLVMKNKLLEAKSKIKNLKQLQANKISAKSVAKDDTKLSLVKKPTKSNKWPFAKKKSTTEKSVKDTKLAEAVPSTGLTAKEKSATVKAAKAGKDIGKPGKGFQKVATKAAKEYGSKEAGKKVAAAAMWKNKVKAVKEAVGEDLLTKGRVSKNADKSTDIKKIVKPASVTKLAESTELSNIKMLSGLK